MPWCRMPPHGVSAFKRDSSQRERRLTNRGGVGGGWKGGGVELPVFFVAGQGGESENFFFVGGCTE